MYTYIYIYIHVESSADVGKSFPAFATTSSTARYIMAKDS